MNSETEKRSIRRILRKKRLQMQYLKLVISTIIVMMITVILTIYITFLFGIERMVPGIYDVSKIKDGLLWLTGILAIETLVFIAFAAWLSLSLSHRIAGPLDRLEKIIREEIDGVPFEIKIRKDDELHDLVEILNELIKKKIIK